MNKEQELVDHIKEGHQKPLDIIYLKYQKEFLLYAKRFSVREEDVLDVYQDSIIALYENIRKGKLVTLTSDLKTYLFAIAKYKIYNIQKKVKTMVNDAPHLGELYEEPEVYPVNISKERQEKLQKAYRQLGVKCREVLRLFYYEGKSLDEIKVALRYTSKDVVKSQKSRCLTQVKQLILKGNG